MKKLTKRTTTSLLIVALLCGLCLSAYLSPIVFDYLIKFKVIFCVQGVISPVLANLYLHHVLDLWTDAWRKTARGDVIMELVELGSDPMHTQAWSGPAHSTTSTKP